MFNSLREWFKAWRRGEKKVGPKGGTGRMYVKKTDASGKVDVKARPKGNISARHYIKAENRWVDLGVIAETSEDN